MSIGEHVSVFVGIVVGLAVADLAVSLHRLLVPRGPVKWDWLAPGLALLMMLNLVGIWWGTYSWYMRVEHFSIRAFLPDIVMLMLNFLAAAAALPDEVPAEGLDLRVHYWRVARYFWTIMAIVHVLILIFVAPRMAAGPMSAPEFLRDQAGTLALLAASLLAIFVRRAWLHGLILAAFLGAWLWTYLDGALL
jgi:hypothetical protein